jgi:hypothetical protein
MDVFRTTPFPGLFTDSADTAHGTTKQDRLQRALDKAITAAEDNRGQSRGTFPIRFTIADVNVASPFPAAHHDGDVTDFIASEVKVAAMYAAYELCAVVRTFATQIGATSQLQLFAELVKQVDPIIISKGPTMTQGEDTKGKSVPITDEHRRPHYADVFTAKPKGGGGLQVDFSPSFLRSMEAMIVPSHNDAAGECIRGIGYSFLNGALAAGKFFDGGGIWLAADFVGIYPKIRQVNSANDGGSGQAGTTRQMARLMALINSGAFSSGADAIDPDKEMFARLGRAVRGLVPWANQGGIPIEKFVLNKVGVAELGRKPGGPNVYSEVSLFKSLKTNGQLYIVAWQNLQTAIGGGKWLIYNTTDIAAVINDTIGNYE